MNFRLRNIIAVIAAVAFIALASSSASAAPPVNDNFANATAIDNGVTAYYAHFLGTNVSATKEASEPNHNGIVGGKSVWYKWTAPSYREMQITLTRSNFNTMISVYTGSALNSLTMVTQNNDISIGNTRSAVNFQPVPGMTYYIAIDGSSLGSGVAEDGDIGFDLGPAIHRMSNDFDRDGLTDLAVFRPADGSWYIRDSSNGKLRSAQWGQSGDIPLAADFTKFPFSGYTDYAVFRPSTGTWYVNYNFEFNPPMFTQFGQAGDIPQVGDFASNTDTDLAVFRPSNGTWYFLTTGSAPQFFARQFGLAGDIPVAGDFDMDEKTDVAVFRPSNGTWYIDRTAGGFQAIQFGMNGDIPVRGDYDADGITDVAVFRPSNSTWYVLRSSNGMFQSFSWGLAGDQPAVGDYNGDGTFDYAVFRPSNGTWYIRYNSFGGGSTAIQFGLTGDIPVTGLIN